MELSINNVTKQFKVKKAVNDISFSMGNGVYGLLGVNGAGKTTLMRMLCTLTTPDCGMITWDGKDIFKMGASYRQILGYLPQDFGYYPYLTIYDYMMYIASIKGIRPAVAKKRTNELLKQVGLSDQRKQKMRNLSGGMVRRVGIAQAMLNDPKILILDEPTAGLDPNERIRFRNLISELAEERLVLLSTHIVSDVEFIANKIVLMKEGQCCFEGTSDEVIASMDKKVYMGVQVSIVVGGGNIWRGRSSENMDRTRADHMGMLATAINALALCSALENCNVPTRVQTAIEMRQVAEPYIRGKAERHLEKGRVVIFGCGTGDPCTSTDTDAALRAVETDSQVILLAKKVDAVYDSDPNINPDAKKYDVLSFSDILSKNLGVMDSTAASMCRDNNMPILVFGLSDPENIVRAVKGEKIGTLVNNEGKL